MSTRTTIFTTLAATALTILTREVTTLIAPSAAKTPPVG